MPHNWLKNESFEADWGDQKSHRCLVFPQGGTPYRSDIGNIFTPPEWITWFRHAPGTWDQPEVRDAWAANDPLRVHGGQKAMLLFTFFRKHDAGFLQQVSVPAGTRLRLTAWAHAWSNHLAASQGGHVDDPRWSDGAGYQTVAWPEASQPQTGDPQQDARSNFAFWVGIDPTGGTDPLANTVVWGPGWHIYNGYAQQLSAEATAQAEQVTVFLRSRTAWGFKHSDAYWDDAELVTVGGVEPEVQLSQRPASPHVGETVTVEARSLAALAGVDLAIRQPSGLELARGAMTVGRDGDWHTWTVTTSPLQEAGTHTVLFSAAGGVETTAAFECAPAPTPQPRGLPREQYARTYVLLPPQAGVAWALAVVDAAWDQRRYTIGGSADDAGIGDLDVRRVIAVNPRQWPGDLQAFFAQHYPGVEYVPLEAATPAELTQILQHL
jgi:hypothetical protein